MHKPFSCLSGTYSNAESATSCDRCLQGHSCPQNTSDPKPCRAGTFAGNGSAVCILCSQGFYSDAEAPKCFPCQEGYRCRSKGTSKAAMYASPCAAGWYSSEGQKECSQCPAGRFSNLTVNSFCHPCEAGSYCAKGSSHPKLCDKGTYRAVPGGSVSNDCSKCQMGEYSDEDGSTACKVCSEGHSSLVGSTSARNCTYKVPILSGMLVSLTMTVFAGCG